MSRQVQFWANCLPHELQHHGAVDHVMWKPATVQSSDAAFEEHPRVASGHHGKDREEHAIAMIRKTNMSSAENIDMDVDGYDDVYLDLFQERTKLGIMYFGCDVLVAQSYEDWSAAGSGRAVEKTRDC